MIKKVSNLKPLDGKLVLVTGASRGIGAATAKLLVKKGAHVILIARTQGGLEELDDHIRRVGGKSTLVPMDLADFEKIDHIGATLFERFGKLDGLVANAGLLGTMGPINHITPKIWDYTMTVNVNANWRLIRSLDPLLRQSDAGRAVFLTSSAARQHRAFWGVYSVSKAALEMMVHTYAKEIENTQILVNLFDPGRTRTNMRAEAYPGENPNILKTPEDVADQIVATVLPSYSLNNQIIVAKEPIK